MYKPWFLEKNEKAFEDYKVGRVGYVVDRDHKFFRIHKVKIKSIEQDNPDEHSPWDVGFTIQLDKGYSSHITYQGMDTNFFVVEKKFSVNSAYWDKDQAIDWYKAFNQHQIKYFKHQKFVQLLIDMCIKFYKKVL